MADLHYRTRKPVIIVILTPRLERHPCRRLGIPVIFWVPKNAFSVDVTSPRRELHDLSLRGEDGAQFTLQRSPAHRERYAKKGEEQAVVLRLQQEVFQLRFAPKMKLADPGVPCPVMKSIVSTFAEVAGSGKDKAVQLLSLIGRNTVEVFDQLFGADNFFALALNQPEARGGG